MESFQILLTSVLTIIKLSINSKFPPPEEKAYTVRLGSLQFKLSHYTFVNPPIFLAKVAI